MIILWIYGVLVAHLQEWYQSFSFAIKPFFHGADNYDQLEKITQVLGTQELFQYLEKYKVNLDKRYEGILGKHTKKSFTKFITMDNKKYCCPEAIDLLSKMLIYDHNERITAKEAMEHPYFAPVIQEQIAKGQQKK